MGLRERLKKLEREAEGFYDTIKLVDGRELRLGPTDRIDCFLSLWPGEEPHWLLEVLPLIAPDNDSKLLEFANLIRCMRAGEELEEEEGEEEPS